MSNLEPVILDVTPILKFYATEKHFPISAVDLLADGKIDNFNFTSQISLLELAEFDPKAPVYVKYRCHGQYADIQFLWLFYPGRWLDCTLEVIERKITKIALGTKWYDIGEFQLKGDRPIIYVTHGCTLLFPHPDATILEDGIKYTSSGGKELISPPIILGGNDYQIKPPVDLKGGYIGSGLDGDPKLMDIKWNGKKMPQIPECQPVEELPLAMDTTMAYILILVFIVLVAIATRHGYQMYKVWKMDSIYKKAAKIRASAS